jgi:hypothetical protein
MQSCGPLLSKVRIITAGHCTPGLAFRVGVSEPVDGLKCQVSLGVARPTILSSP